jgi:hypothetical protein
LADGRLAFASRRDLAVILLVMLANCPRAGRSASKAQWRTPKLIGVDVYGADNKKIGKIDILMGHDGKAQAVVIGVGGFLGIGKKDVGVPFSAIEWKTEPRKVPATDLQPTNPVAPNTTGQTAGPPPMKETDPAATEGTFLGSVFHVASQRLVHMQEHGVGARARG